MMTGGMFWSFPKGHQENNETDIETALRETFEEVGLEVEIIDNAPIVVSHFIHNGTGVKDIFLFLAKNIGEEIRLQQDEVEIIKWADFSEADKLLAYYYKKAWRETKGRM